MRPIILATDYGVSGSYVGQLKTQIYTLNPDAAVIDLIHDLPKYNPRASAYLLASLLEQLPKNSVVIGVVDPGVGSSREPIVLEAGGYSFVGPNNGLFAIIAKKLKDFGLLEIMHKEPKSKTFHGRDLFAPTAVQLASNEEIKLKKLTTKRLVGAEWPKDLAEIIYIDHFGNAITGISAKKCNSKQIFKIKENKIKHANTFSEVNIGECFWYANSSQLVEISARDTSVAEKLKLKIRDQVLM